MRVLWFLVTPPPEYTTKVSGGWMASLAAIVHNHCSNIELGMVFEHNNKCFKEEKNRSTYYPINKSKSKLDKVKFLLNSKQEWNALKPHCIKVIEDFKPDIIQVFGSEWAFGLLAKETNIPIVVHMQGFFNIYTDMSEITLRKSDIIQYYKYNPLRIVKMKLDERKGKDRAKQELDIMYCNRYFLGRTEWDKNIVKYHSPNSVYFHCEEAIRDVIKESPVRWKFIKSDKFKIITISSASSLKGNDIILKTAKLLKDFGFNFEWRVAGNKKSFEQFESKCGINHKDVNVETIGLVNAEQVANELSEAHVYVHTAIIDNSPNSLCEAQLIGCPVVSANVGGIPQLVEDGVSGILYPHNEYHTLAFLLMSLHNDKEKLESLSNAELEQSHARHNQQSIATELVSIYSQILSR